MASSDWKFREAVFEVITVKLIKRKNILGRGNSKYKGFKVGLNLCMTEEPRESRCGRSTVGEKADTAMRCEVSASACVWGEEFGFYSP